MPGQVNFNVKRAAGTIVIDGKLDEKDWQLANRAGNFVQTFPSDDRLAIDSTQFMVTYTDAFIYIGVICYDYLPGRPITSSLRRDFDWRRNDNVSVYIDPFNDKSNGFAFQVTYDNVQREGIVVLGGDVQQDWDNKWYSEVHQEEKFWSVELAIPFKSIRFNSVAQWNMQVIRNNQKRNEISAWIQVPQQFRMSDMNYTGAWLWDNPPPEAGPNVSFIPYVAGGASRNFESPDWKSTTLGAGFDAKIGVTNSLNLDLTYNPDFSQVEVDQQVTNLQRFELFFPERRQFFLENQDLFATNGFPIARPFFSRRIGVQGSGSTQRTVPIIGGARLSGKLGKNWRVGLLNMVTNEDNLRSSEEGVANYSPEQNYSMAVIERQLFKRSRISAIFVGRTNLGMAALDSFRVSNNSIFDRQGRTLSPLDTLITLSAYNYVYGLDYNLATEDNSWTGNFYYHESVDPERQTNNFSQGGYLRYQKRKYQLEVFQMVIGDGYNAEVGFVPRNGINVYGTSLEYNFFPTGKIQRHGPKVSANNVTDPHWNVLDSELRTEYTFRFLNTSELTAGYNWQSIFLQSPFDPSRSGGEELPANQPYAFADGFVSYQSDQRKDFSVSGFARLGEFYTGSRRAIGLNFDYRFRPILQVNLGAEYNAIDLPAPFTNAQLLLINPRIDLTLSRSVFITSFIQYNTQDNNFGQNHRFQWRFKPVSDLFIVYTDNYLTTSYFQARNRMLVFKLSYWLNV